MTKSNSEISEETTTLLSMNSGTDNSKPEFSLDEAVVDLIKEKNRLQHQVHNFEYRTNIIQGILFDRLPMKESLMLSEFLEGKLSEQYILKELNIKPL